MITRRRFREWLAALAEEKRTAGRIPWLTFALALVGGVVPRSEWIYRMRTCKRCPFYREHLNLCKSPLPYYRDQGCRCVVWAVALVPDAKRAGGCYGYVRFNGQLGWPAYWMGRWERLWSPIRFLLRR